MSFYDAYWELRRTLKSEAVLDKTSAGNDLLPPGEDPDVEIDTTENTITISLSSNDTCDLLGEYYQYLYLREITTGKKTSVMYGTLNFLESPDSEYPDYTYTTPELVVSQLRLTNGDGSKLILTEDSDPKRSEVVEYIRQAETYIDRTTKNAWRETAVVDEYHDISIPLHALPRYDVAISLRFANIRPWDPEKGDKIIVFQTGSWVDYTNTAQAVFNNTWWIDYKIGVVHFNNFYPWYYAGSNRVKICYRWGKDPVPADICEAATKVVAIRLLQSEFNKIMLYNRSSNPINWNQVIQYWQKDCDRTFANNRRKLFSASTR